MLFFLFFFLRDFFVEYAWRCEQTEIKKKKLRDYNVFFFFFSLLISTCSSIFALCIWQAKTKLSHCLYFSLFKFFRFSFFRSFFLLLCAFLSSMCVWSFFEKKTKLKNYFDCLLLWWFNEKTFINQEKNKESRLRYIFTDFMKYIVCGLSNSKKRFRVSNLIW
jgi:hypothetical protein